MSPAESVESPPEKSARTLKLLHDPRSPHSSGTTYDDSLSHGYLDGWNINHDLNFLLASIKLVSLETPTASPSVTALLSASFYRKQNPLTMSSYPPNSHLDATSRSVSGFEQGALDAHQTVDLADGIFEDQHAITCEVRRAPKSELLLTSPQIKY